MTSSTQPEPRSGPLSFIRNPQDFWGGLGLLILAGVAWWASSSLPGQQGFAFGPGTAPRLFIVLLAINAAAIMIGGLLVDGPKIDRWNFRAVLFVLGAVLVFSATIRPLGLIPATFLLVMTSAAGSNETKWIETTIWAVILAVFCAILFPYGLNLPMQLWPRF